MEEMKFSEYIVGALGLLFFIGMGVLLGYLINELRWKARETKRQMIDMIDDHEIAKAKFSGALSYINKEERKDNRAEGKKHHTSFKSRDDGSVKSKVKE